MLSPLKTSSLALLALVGWTSIQTASAEQRCEVLKTSLVFSQEKAPRDLSGVLPVVVERVNRVLEGVVNVEVLWEGADFQGLVGDHIINCKVTRLATVLHGELLQDRDVSVDEMGREVATQCFQVPFSISDTNECTLPQNHPIRHQCQDPAICVNTIGSYECMCPRIDGTIPANLQRSRGGGHHHHALDLSKEQEQFFFEALFQEERTAWELSFNTSVLTSCPLHSTTKDCCPYLAHSSDGMDCRARFHCPADPCASSPTAADNNHQCVANAQCVRAFNPRQDPNYACHCPEGLMGNGKKCRPGVDPTPEPKITFDGHPTQETIKNDYYCGCTKPIVDACSGYPPCRNKHEVCVVGPGNEPRCDCKKGFIRHAEYGCVDETPPKLKLNHDPQHDHTLRLKQGDFYEEYGVEIKDVNAEDYRRSLQISYSDPLPKGCATKIGEFHVNYTVAMPWTKEGFVRITRRVVIDDIDECAVDVAKFSKTCPELVPQCDTAAGAKCVNMVGSYACECPQYTTGDGFLPGAKFDPRSPPKGFGGGTGCTDTSKPVIHLKGPHPKIFKICACGGLKGFMSDKSENLDESLQTSQREHYEREIKQMIRETQGAELCATHDNPRPHPSSCAEAFDETYKGRVDLTARIEVGDPVRKSHLHWSVPYNVKDDAGNHATTIYREVVVEEVDVESLEASIKKGVTAAKDLEIKKAVDKAVAEERRRLENDNKRPGTMGRAPRECPPCPQCDASPSKEGSGASGEKVDLSMCDKICEERAQQCSIREESFVVTAMLWLESMLPTFLVKPVLSVLLVFGLFWVLRLIFTLLLNPRALFAPSYDYTYDAERGKYMEGTVTYYQGETPQSQRPTQHQREQTPYPSMGSRPLNAGGLFSGSGAPPRTSLSAEPRDNDSFFLSPQHAGASPAGAFPFGSPPGTNGSQQNGNRMDDPNDIYFDAPQERITPRKASGHRSPFSS